MIRIVTKLDKNAAVAALREFVPKAHNPRWYRSTFEGEVSNSRLTVGYRFGWFAPPIRLVTFSGQLGETDGGTVIAGTMSSGWVVYIYAAWLFVVAPLSLIQAVLDRDVSDVLLVLVVSIFLFFLGRAFVRSTRTYVLEEIRRAVRGKIEKY